MTREPAPPLDVARAPGRHRRARLHGVALVWFAAGALCCAPASTPTARREITFQGSAIAEVKESVRTAGARRVVTRDVRLDGEQIRLEATLDAQGAVVSARYSRPASSGQLRALTFTPAASAATALRITDVTPSAPGLPRALSSLNTIGEPAGATRPSADVPGPVFFLELLGHSRPGSTPQPITVVDPASAEAVAATLVREGGAAVVRDLHGTFIARATVRGLESSRTGPGAFAEGDHPPELPRVPVTLPVPGAADVSRLRLVEAPLAPGRSWRALPTADDAQAALFLEADHPHVRALAASLGPPASALEDARRVAERVHALVDARATRVPPGAVAMLAHGGDCDGAAALVVAVLRARGHRARPVVGHLLQDPGTTQARLVPHAVAALHVEGVPTIADRVESPAGGSWWWVDATRPAVEAAARARPAARSDGSAARPGAPGASDGTRDGARAVVPEGEPDGEPDSAPDAEPWRRGRFLPYGVGLGGALGMGRVLGVAHVDASGAAQP